MNNQPVSITLKELIFNDKIDHNIIKRAFGKNSLGIILVTDIPEIEKAIADFISNGRKFIDIKDKSKYEIPKAFYSVGWSYGKEKMKNNKPDFAKGSFYANPMTDEPTEDKELINKYPGSYHPNVWPTEVPNFESHFKDMGISISFIGIMILLYCTEYLKSIGLNVDLQDLISSSNTYKGRFLHYFPAKPNDNNKDDALCGWHCDSGCLTGLIPARYYDKNGEEIKKPNDCGLFIKDRKNNLVKVNIPRNAMAFQIGEIIQVLTGGELIATPHCVKSSQKPDITRNTFALFMDVKPDYKIYVPKNYDVKQSIHIKNLPNGVPPMEGRFYNGISYAEFLDKTYQAYYN